jgi:hypothetical protein
MRVGLSIPETEQLQVGYLNGKDRPPNALTQAKFWTVRLKRTTEFGARSRSR